MQSFWQHHIPSEIIMFNRDLVNTVREMLERNWDIYEMATKLKMDPHLVRAIVDFINGTLT